jgi:hypothetical protein
MAQWLEAGNLTRKREQTADVVQPQFQILLQAKSPGRMRTWKRLEKAVGM